MSKYNVKVPFNANSTMVLADLNKEGLRTACKFNGVKGYGNMTNDGMRDALIAKVAAANAEQGIGEQGSDGRPRPVAAKTKIATLNVETGTVTPVIPDVVGTLAKGVVETPVVETPVIRETTVGTVVKPKSLKIEKVRDEQNKVRRPSSGSICRSIWDALDASRAATNAVPTFENLRDLMKAHNWSRNTAMTQYQRWKQFNGVMPRTVDAEEVDADSQDE